MSPRLLLDRRDIIVSAGGRHATPLEREAGSGAERGPPLESKLRGRDQLEFEDYLLLTTVSLLPWAFGGVDMWSYRCASLLVLAAASLALWKRGWAGWGLGRGAGWLLPAFLLALWGGLQLVPLPPGAIRAISPRAYDMYARVFPGYDGALTVDPQRALESRALERAGNVPALDPVAGSTSETGLRLPECSTKRWRSLSLEPGATLERLLWYVALLLGFLVIRERVSSRDRRSVYLWALFLTLTALALFGLVQRQLWKGEIYWFRKVLVPVFPFGPYFNPNHFAGAMLLAVPALAGHAWGRLLRGGRAALYEARFGLAAVGAATCLVAGFGTMSKSAAVLLPGSLLILALAGARTLRARLAVVGVGVLLLALTGGLLLNSGVASRFEQLVGSSEEATLEGRTVVWQASLDMFRDYPVTGAGFGAFGYVFVRYMPAGTRYRWGHVHNDYIELLLEGGIVAGALFVWLLAGYAWRVVRRLRRSTPLSPGRIGLVLGICLMSLQALMDFNHQVPANALLFVTFCAILLPAGKAAARTSSGARVMALLLVAGLGGLYGYRAVTGIPASHSLERGHKLRNARGYINAPPWLEVGAVGINRPRALLMAGQTRLRRWESQVRQKGTIGAGEELLRLAADDFFLAQCSAPGSRAAWLGLGDVYHDFERMSSQRRSELRTSRVEEVRRGAGRSGRIALGMMHLALEAAPNWSQVHDRLAVIQWAYGLDDESRRSVRDSARTLPMFVFHPYYLRPSLPDWFSTEFADASRDALGQVPFVPRPKHLIDLGKLERRIGEPERAVEYMQEALESRLSVLMRAEANFHLGLALIDSGRAEEGRRHLLQSLENPVFMRPSLRHLAYLAEQTGQDAQALEYLRRLRREQPDDLEPCIEFAEVAGRMGDWDAALESLRWAKLKHPSNPRPYVTMVRTQLAMGDLASARLTLAELEQLAGALPGQTAALRRAVETASPAR